MGQLVRGCWCDRRGCTCETDEQIRALARGLLDFDMHSKAWMLIASILFAIGSVLHM